MEEVDDKQNLLLFSLMKAYIAQVDSAIKIAKIISDHSEEEELSADALIAGLVYRLMVPMNEKEMKESLEYATNVLDESEGEDDDEEEEEGCELKLDESISRKLKKNNCNCDICCRARACLINYPNYEAPDSLAEKFKNAIHNACVLHKIII